MDWVFCWRQENFEAGNTLETENFGVRKTIKSGTEKSTIKEKTITLPLDIEYKLGHRYSRKLLEGKK